MENVTFAHEVTPVENLKDEIASIKAMWEKKIIGVKEMIRLEEKAFARYKKESKACCFQRRLKKPSGWIKVQDQLPEPGKLEHAFMHGCVLAFNGCVHVAKHTENGFYHKGYLDGVTHWMPIPLQE